MASAGVPTFQGTPGKRLTILTIDGGGVRGVIPAKLLEVLEKQLQEVDGPDVRLADYFDVIGGTSTGGLIAAMLACPDGGHEHPRPLYSASDAPKFYNDYAATIFPAQPGGVLGTAESVVELLARPKYTADSLERILTEKFQNIRMKETVTELLIPAYDIKSMQPTIMSTAMAKNDPLSNVQLRDACRGTSAAPTYFPPYRFEVSDPEGKTSREYNLIDGGLAANNPTYLSIVHVLQKQFDASQSFRKRMMQGKFGNLLVLSLGTGTRPQSISANEADKWGSIKWVVNDGRVPLLDISMNASADMVEIYLSVLFETVESGDNYLRIQADNLPEGLTKLDSSTPENLEGLSHVADQLLDSEVKALNPITGDYVLQLSRGTNREALARFAKELIEERHIRISNKKI